MWTPPLERFDLVVCLYVHIAGSVEEMVCRMGRGVAPGGALFMVGHRPIDPATGKPTAAAGQVQVSVEGARAALDPSGWDDVHAVSARGPFFLLQTLAPRLRERGGDVVLATGMATLRPMAAPPHAAAAQAALAGLARSLPRALGAKVRVNVVSFGTLDGGTADRIDPRFAAAQARFTALARTGTAVEAARALCWLALENRYINGAILPVDGGWLAR